MSTCWNVREDSFPQHGTPSQKLRFALHYATLAPSSHNSQPWRFLQSGTTVSFIADRTRGLAVIDPYDRELLISCGAAIVAACVALSHFRLGFELDAFPAQAEPDVLAVLRLRKDRAPDTHLAALFPAICKRVTNRGHFEQTPVPGALQSQMIEDAQAEGIILKMVTSEAQRARLAKLITQADTTQFADPRFRRELASWIHGSRSFDGMPGYALGVPPLLDFATPLAGMVLRTFDVGTGVAARDDALVQGSPLLICFGTNGDNAAEWMFCGQALMRVLLRACLDGFDASYLNQPIEIPDLRKELQTALGMEEIPQLLIRMGKGLMTEHTPRRPIAEVVP